jgi:ribosomal protein L7/L12
MRIEEYFQAHENYFWQWEDSLQVIAIPNGNTIAYKDFAIETLRFLAPQGIPPFGALLIAIAATNPNGKDSIRAILNAIPQKEPLNYSNFVKTIEPFLTILADMPQKYKEGQKRLLLFQAIFEGCHNMLSTGNAHRIINLYLPSEQRGSATQKVLKTSVSNRDFSVLLSCAAKFKSVNDIITKMGLTTEIEPETLDLEDNKAETPQKDPKDFIEQLTEKNKTFFVGALVKRIWGGLNIPVHSALPSQQPLGGFSDLTNKGDFDKLLISEFANDDLIFLSRLANNEALYIHREVPPVNNDLKRVILIDISLKNWGTPKTIAFALMLAIAKHPKTNIECSAFAIGNSYYPLLMDSVDDIIDGLQLLEGSLNASEGLHHFLKENNDQNLEIFLITEASTLKQADFLRALHEHQAHIHYIIHPDAVGNIDIYKKQKNSKKHIQHILLPLNELWERKRLEPENKIQSEKIGNNKYPILVKPSPKGKFFEASDGTVFQVTNHKTLLKRHSKTNDKATGWEIIAEDLAMSANGGEYEVGLLDNGEYVILMFNIQSKIVTLWNLNSDDKKEFEFKEWSTSRTKEFFFHEQSFYFINHHYNWCIDPITAEVVKTHHNMVNIYQVDLHRRQVLSKNNKEFSTPFTNINYVRINSARELVFNVHTLQTNNGTINLNNISTSENLCEINGKFESKFKFADGSTIEIKKIGLFVLKSANKNIPTIFMISDLGHNTSVALATKNAFSGNDYYSKKGGFDLILDTGTNGLLRPELIALIESTMKIGFAKAEKTLENLPSIILSGITKERAGKLMDEFESLGASTHIRSSNQISEDDEEIEKIEPKIFFQQYIDPFIKHILDHGTQHQALS